MVTQDIAHRRIVSHIRQHVHVFIREGLAELPENNALGSVFRTFERFDALIQITEEARHATALADALRQLALGEMCIRDRINEA